MKIYKFRPLVECEDFCRLKEIIETKEFHCSNFWDLNDPMEGVFNFSIKNIESRIKDVYDGKNSYKICSFSGIEGFINSIMWGYYASGFKGVAIELEIEVIAKDDQCGECGGVKEIKRNDNLPNDSDIEKILLHKNTIWKHEDEYRFLIKSDNEKHVIREITAIYFGNPYGNLHNTEIIRKNKKLTEYNKFKEKIIEIAKRKEIKCFNVKIKNGEVKKLNKILWNQK